MRVLKPPERFTISAISTSPGGHEKKKKKKVANRNAYERYMTDGAIATPEIAVTIMVDVVIAAATDEGKAETDVDLDENTTIAAVSLIAIMVPWGLQISECMRSAEKGMT